MGVGALVVCNPPLLSSLERRFLEDVELDDESDDDKKINCLSSEYHRNTLAYRR